MALDAASSPGIDHVVAIFPRAELSAALAATHRAGFGPQTLSSMERGATPHGNWSGQGCAFSMELHRPRTRC